MTEKGAPKGAPKISVTWETVLTRFGRKKEIPEDYEPSEQASHIWNTFRFLSDRRKYHDGHPFAIELSEIVAYNELMGPALSQVDVRIILEMDTVFRSAFAEAKEDQRRYNGPSSSQPTARPTKSKSMARK